MPSPADVSIPWTLLLSRLRGSGNTFIRYDELQETGASPGALIGAGLVRVSAGWGAMPACDHMCTPRRVGDPGDGSLFVECPHALPCVHGLVHIRGSVHRKLRMRVSNIFATLAQKNGLETLALNVQAPFLPIGIFHKGERAFPVVWLRAPRQGFELWCRGLREQLGMGALIVVVGTDPCIPLHPRDRISVVELPVTSNGDLQLDRALDWLLPERLTPPAAVEETNVRLRFATLPGERHIVYINDTEAAGFRYSDGRFLRFLRIAAARKKGENGGWIAKDLLSDKKGFQKLCETLRKSEIPGLGRSGARPLIKVQRGTGLVRLLVSPENIDFGESLRSFEFVTRGTNQTSNQEEGRRTAELLLRDCQELGAPIGDREARGSIGPDERMTTGVYPRLEVSMAESLSGRAKDPR